MQQTSSNSAPLASQPLQAVIRACGQVVLGKSQQIRLALCALLAQGHLLIEDIPGVGKTLLAHSLAQLLGLDYQRIQFTSDMLPADVLGCSIYHPREQGFSFHRGPIFHHVVLADEINRSSARTQSALLEAMEENQVTVEGTTHPLPQPFFVIATQNPLQQEGTFALPESQLDRFLMRLKLGYPPAASERILLRQGYRRPPPLKALLRAGELALLQAQCQQVTAREAVLDYLQNLLQYSRNGSFRQGLSPRAGIALLTAAKAWAFLAGRSFLLPEDIQAVLAAVVEHRLQHRDKPLEAASPYLLKAVTIDP